MTFKKFATLSMTSFALSTAAFALTAPQSLACDMANCPHKAKGDKAKACDCGREDCKGKDCPYGKKGAHKAKKSADADAAAPAPAADAEKPAAH